MVSMGEVTQTQVNTRIDSALKARGDAAFQRAGITPSRAVRSLWRFAAAHSHEPEVIVRETARLDGVAEDPSEEVRAKLEACRRGQRLFAEFMAATGISPAVLETMEQLSLNELREQELLERYGYGEGKAGGCQ